LLIEGYRTANYRLYYRPKVDSYTLLLILNNRLCGPEIGHPAHEMLNFW
jgi:hypothetical protein